MGGKKEEMGGNRGVLFGLALANAVMFVFFGELVIMLGPLHQGFFLAVGLTLGALLVMVGAMVGCVISLVQPRVSGR